MRSKKKTHAIVLTGTLLLLITGVLSWYLQPVPHIPKGVSIDYINVSKSKHELRAYSRGQLIVTYKVALGRHQGKKVYEGDLKTPEGRYTINDRNPYSGYHKNLGVSYPNAADRKQAQQLGRPSGGDIKIHGLRNGQGYIGRFHRLRDWTNGCIALDNAEVDELYTHVLTGATIDIVQ